MLMRPADHRAPWQIAQGDACGCRGWDDMCPCQNVERVVSSRREAIAEDFGLVCLVCGEDLQTGPRGACDCPACNPDPARG